MRNYLLTAIAMCGAVAHAVPMEFAHQGRLLNADGVPIPIPLAVDPPKRISVSESTSLQTFDADLPAWLITEARESAGR